VCVKLLRGLQDLQFYDGEPTLKAFSDKAHLVEECMMLETKGTRQRLDVQRRSSWIVSVLSWRVWPVPI